MTFLNYRRDCEFRRWPYEFLFGMVLSFLVSMSTCFGQEREPSHVTKALMNETITMLEIGLRELRLRTDSDMKRLFEKHKMGSQTAVRLSTRYDDFDDLIIAYVHFSGSAPQDLAVTVCSELISAMRPIVRNAIENERVFSPSEYKNNWQRALGAGAEKELASRTQLGCSTTVSDRDFDLWMDARSMLLEEHIKTTTRGDDSK